MQAAIKSAGSATQTAETQQSYCTVRGAVRTGMCRLRIATSAHTSAEKHPRQNSPQSEEDDRMVLYISVDDESTMAAIQQARADGSLPISTAFHSLSPTPQKAHTPQTSTIWRRASTHPPGTIQLQALIDNTLRRTAQRHVCHRRPSAEHRLPPPYSCATLHRKRPAGANTYTPSATPTLSSIHP